MRIALVSTGLGNVFRGFEAFTDSLFGALEKWYPSVDVTLFKGGGTGGKRQTIVPNLARSAYPAALFGSSKANLLEKRSFALALFPQLLAGGYDLVHYNELTMGSALFHLRRFFGGNFKLLYCNGAPSPPVHYAHRCDFAQMLTRGAFDEAIAYGVEEQRLFHLPYGVDGELFRPGTKEFRCSTREALGVPEQAKVILSVAAIKRDHKRIDYLIREVARAGRDYWLVVCGQRTEETSALERLAEEQLPGRWMFTTVPHAETPKVYSMADVFVLASLSEAFGLVTVEAMLCELPVILHNGPEFVELTSGAAARLIDMSTAGELTRTLSEVDSEGRAQRQRRLREARRVIGDRFAWRSLAEQYVEMYRRVAGVGVPTGESTGRRTWDWRKAFAPR